MTTIIDPNGTPDPVYTRSGTTIQEVMAAGTNGMPATATPITAVSGWSVVLADATVDQQGVMLPDDAQIGDIVEVHNVASSYSIRVYPPSGETLGGGVSRVIGPSDAGIICRKTAAAAWRFV